MEAIQNMKPFDGTEVKKYYMNQTEHLSLAEGEIFEDKLFPHDESALWSKEYRDKENKKLFYPEQLEFIKNEVKPDRIEFKRAMDVYKGDLYYVFENTIDVGDIKQGEFSDCYFLSAVASLTEFPEFIFSKFRTRQPNKLGFYEVILFVDGEWQIVVVDDYFPYSKGTKSYAFTGSNNNELWVIILEKAWAKINGGYSNIVLGHVSDAFQALTGFSYEHVKDINIFTKDELWDKVKKSDDVGYIMCTGTKNEKYVTNYGLVQGHAYTLISAKEKNTDKGKNIRLLSLFNPWGRQEWTGDWSDRSPLWDPELEKFFGKKVEDDGIFFMDLESYPGYYESLYICHMMYDSIISSYKVPAEQSKKALVFGFDVSEDSDAKISVFLKHWRFHRDMLGVERPTSFVCARINDEGKIDYLKGQFTFRDDIHFIERLEKGKYLIWVYSVLPEIENPYTLRFASEKPYTSYFIGEDTNFEIINYLIGQHKLYEFSQNPNANKTGFVLETDLTLKQAGIFSYVAINFDKKNLFDLIITPGDISLFHPMSQLGTDKKAKVTMASEDVYVFSVIRNKESEEVFKITNKRDRSKVKKQDTNTFAAVKAAIATVVENPPFDQFQYKFPTKDNLQVKKFFEKKGQIIKDNYDEGDLLAENEFIANEIFKKMRKIGKTPTYWLEKNSEGYYMGEKRVDNVLYFGARYFEGSKEFYIGWFRDGLFYQKGKYYKNNKLYYKGEYKNGKMHGQGILFSENRDIFRGPFVEGRKKGLHRIYHENTNSLTVCFMDNDKRYGYALEVNYPQRNTRIAFYKDDSLYNFLVVEYPFFKNTFSSTYFEVADSSKDLNYPSFFENKLREKLPCDNLDDLLLKRIHMEMKENRDTRKYNPFMYDMLRSLSANYFTLIDIDKDHEGNMIMQTREKTDIVYKLDDLECYVFFLNITNNKPYYDRAVRWVIFGQDQVLKYVGTFEELMDAKYYEANGSGRYLNVLYKDDKRSVAYYYFPERGCSYGDFSFNEGEQVFETYYFSGFQNNYVHIKMVEDDKKRKKKDKDDKDDKDKKDGDDDEKNQKRRSEEEDKEPEDVLQAENGEENVDTNLNKPAKKDAKKKKGPNLDEITGKRYDYFIPKKEAEELHMEKLYTRELYKKEVLRGKEDEKHKQVFLELLRKYYPFFYTLPAGKASDEDETFDFLKFEIEYNKYIEDTLTLEIKQGKKSILQYYEINKGNVCEEKLVSRSQIFEKHIGSLTSENGQHQYIGAINEFKRHGRGLEIFKDEKTQKDKHMHMIYNTKERDSVNLEWIDTEGTPSESYYYNDGIKCSERLSLVMFEKQNVIGKEETEEERTERRRINDIKIKNKMYKVYLKPEEYKARGLDQQEHVPFKKVTTKEKEKKWPVNKREPEKRPAGIEIDTEFATLTELYSMYDKPAFLLDLLFNGMKPLQHPHLKWAWKHTINGLYLGEVDPFDQSCGRGLMIYTSYSKNTGAYLGYWDADVRHGEGITINIKKKQYYCCRFYIDEEKTNDTVEVPANIADELNKHGYKYRLRRDWSHEIDTPDVFVEHDTETGEPLYLEDKLETLQLFAGKDDDVTKPINLVSEDESDAPKSSSKNVKICDIYELVCTIKKRFIKD